MSFTKGHPIDFTANGDTTAEALGKLIEEATDIYTHLNTLLARVTPSGNWKVYYSDGDGTVQALALGTSGQVLQANGATAAPTFETLSIPNIDHIKAPCRVATTAALTATYNGTALTLTNAGAQAALALDGVTLSASDRVLVKNQADGTQNGIYVVTATGNDAENWVLTRASGSNTSAEMVPSLLVMVQEGTVNADTLWTLTTNGAITLDTTSLAFSLASPSRGKQTFTSNGTFTVPAGISTVYLTMCGGGGGGGGVDGQSSDGIRTGGGGGGAQAYRHYPVSVTPGDSITVTIGTGGAGGSAGDNNGTAGNNTTFGALLTATGGGAGDKGTVKTGGAAGGDGGSPGANGEAFVYSTGPVIYTLAGMGGGCILSPGGGLPSIGAAGTGGAGNKYGSGGAGGRSINTGDAAGGAGADGVCIVEW